MVSQQDRHGRDGPFCCYTQCPTCSWQDCSDLGLLVAEFLGAVTGSFQLCCQWELGRGRAGQKTYPAMLEEFSGLKPEATIAGEGWSWFLTREYCFLWGSPSLNRLGIWPVTGCGFSARKLHPTDFPLDRDAWGHCTWWIGLCSELLESLMRSAWCLKSSCLDSVFLFDMTLVYFTGTLFREPLKIKVRQVFIRSFLTSSLCVLWLTTV